MHLLICTTDNKQPLGINTSQTHMSERTRNILAIYEQKKAGKQGIGGSIKNTAQGARDGVYHAASWTYATLCWLMGTSTFFLFGFSALYTLVAFREEFVGAWEATKDCVFGK